MRAEAQQYIDRIDAALDLLRRFLDWDRALRRLDELNARVEDPTLWDDAKKAQEVMRERTRLDSAISATRAIDSEKSDTAELIDAATQKPVMKVVRKGEGKTLSNESTPLTVDTLKQVIDDMAIDAVKFDPSNR